jgi:ribosomal protein S17
VTAIECRPVSKNKHFRLKSVRSGANAWFKVLQD